MSDKYRKFERMLPGMMYANSQFEKDILAGGRNYAEQQRRIREQTQSNIQETLEEDKRIIGTYTYNLETGEETYTPAQ